MPRVSRNYQRADFSDLLEELQSPEGKESEAGCEKTEREKSDQGEQVTSFQRKRASLLDNRSMRYAYSEKRRVLHDRDCEKVKSIPDQSFRMLPDFSEGFQPCPHCYRKAMIRRGIADDAKRINAYVRIFDRMGASDRELHRLFIENDAHAYGVERDRVFIKVREDKWLIRLIENELRLFHNNYEVIGDYQRLFREGFHLQEDGGVHTFRKFVHIMSRYSWKGHVRHYRAEEEARLREELRRRLEGTPNYLRLAGRSLFCASYLFADCGNYALKLCGERGIACRVERKTTDMDHTYQIVSCRVWLWRRKRFLQIMDALKEHSVECGYRDYARQCGEMAGGVKTT